MPFLRALVPASLVVLAPAMALAQGDPAASPAPAPAPPPTSTAGAAPPPPKVSATGYGYDTPKAARGAAHPRRIARVAGPVATLPGFEVLADGASRLFVQLTQAVPVEEKRAAGTITYVLKGAHVAKYNNERPLVTVHFNTPVYRARLVPAGHDLLFVVELRAAVQPTWRMEAAKDGGAVLAIDFPKGDFLAAPSGDAAEGETQVAPSMPRARRAPAGAAPKK